MYAYNEMYLDEAMSHLGEMLDYAVNDIGYDILTFWQMFFSSHVGKQFSIGNPKYNAGMSGIELAMEVIYGKTGRWVDVPVSNTLDCSKEYWVGWALAYYQHQRNMDFKRLSELGIGAAQVHDMYILHEADISKFCEMADKILERNISLEENRLKRLRKYARLRILLDS